MNERLQRPHRRFSRASCQTVTGRPAKALVALDEMGLMAHGLEAPSLTASDFLRALVWTVDDDPGAHGDLAALNQVKTACYGFDHAPRRSTGGGFTDHECSPVEVVCPLLPQADQGSLWRGVMASVQRHPRVLPVAGEERSDVVGQIASERRDFAGKAGRLLAEEDDVIGVGLTGACGFTPKRSGGTAKAIERALENVAGLAKLVLDFVPVIADRGFAALDSSGAGTDPTLRGISAEVIHDASFSVGENAGKPEDLPAKARNVPGITGPTRVSPCVDAVSRASRAKWTKWLSDMGINSLPSRSR